MTSRRETPTPYQHAMELARAGRNQQALTCIQDHLLAQPRDAAALNDAGALLFALGRLDEAARHLQQAMQLLGPTDAMPAWNLVEVFVTNGQVDRAIGLLDQLLAADTLSAELANHLATKLIQRGDLAGGIEALLRSFQIDPNQQALAELYARVRGMRAKVAFFTDFGDARLGENVHQFFRARFETRREEGRDPRRIAELLEWCDIAWFDWCGPQLGIASGLPKTCRIACRLHGHEAFLGWVEQVRWPHVDLLITSGNRHVLEHLRATATGLESVRVLSIPAGVDLPAMELRPRPWGKHLACLAPVPYAENTALVLQCFHKLHSIDPDFRLHLAGPAQHIGPRNHYLRAVADEFGLAGAVTFEPAPSHVGDWLSDKHYIVSCSLHEGHPVHVLEGMACGLKPVVHAWPGCRDFFPDEYLFRSIDEFCHRVLDTSWQQEDYRAHVARSFALADQLGKIHAAVMGWDNTVTAPHRARSAGSWRLVDDQAPCPPAGGGPSRKGDTA